MLTPLRESLKPYTQSMREYALSADQQSDLPKEYIQNTYFLPLWQLGTPRKFGYQGIKGTDNKYYFGESTLELAIWTEEIAYGDPTMLLTLPGPQLLGPLISSIGEMEQQDKFFSSFITNRPVWASFGLTEPSAGSDVSNICTTAKKKNGNYELNGEKKYIGNGMRASWLCVFAKVGDIRKAYSIQCFLFDPVSIQQKGLLRKEISSLGMKPSKLTHITLENAEIHHKYLLGYNKSSLKRGLIGANHVFFRMRPSVSALAIGTSRAVIDYVKEYFNLSPSHILTLDKLCWKVKKAQLLIYKAAKEVDQGIYDRKSSSLAKWYGNSIVYEVTRICNQIVGPRIIEHPLLEKWFRDARMIEFMEGTTNIHKNIAGKQIIINTKCEGRNINV